MSPMFVDDIFSTLCRDLSLTKSYVSPQIGRYCLRRGKCEQYLGMTPYDTAQQSHRALQMKKGKEMMQSCTHPVAHPFLRERKSGHNQNFSLFGTHHDRDVQEMHVLVQDVGRLPGCGLRRLRQKLRFGHGHVEVQRPVFQPLLLPVHLRYVFSCARHFWRQQGERERKNRKEGEEGWVCESKFNQ